MTTDTLEIPQPDTMVDLARSYAGEAVIALVGLMRTAKSEQVRLSAAKEILSRGYGRASKVAAADVAVPARVAAAKASPQAQIPQPPSAPVPQPRPQQPPFAAVPPRERDVVPPILPMVAALKSSTAALNGGSHLSRS